MLNNVDLDRLSSNELCNYLKKSCCPEIKRIMHETISEI
jgi:hypothetical protein